VLPLKRQAFITIVAQHKNGPYGNVRHALRPSIFQYTYHQDCKVHGSGFFRKSLVEKEVQWKDLTYKNKDLYSLLKQRRLWQNFTADEDSEAICQDTLAKTHITDVQSKECLVFIIHNCSELVMNSLS
jgi:hypothetical protein